ncbi:hypothetical protein [Bradyrhizobium iriomotense]|uniref:Uncharacterized protein n=1 Tax=Bradyrhizobium iriomotense TaxID=441950 RepID=A0ABQ6B6Q9_9BRAD|nr:hypothetical protein [Bradyrhizobium iriomotense]GLR90065.1 hypothetical protein GCM10007857_67790 [Bradyrhizobium iriomotense]
MYQSVDADAAPLLVNNGGNSPKRLDGAKLMAPMTSAEASMTWFEINWLAPIWVAQVLFRELRTVIPSLIVC